MKLTVCIPMYNEAEIVSDAVRALTDKLEDSAALHNFEYEILFSDDGSADGCGKIARDTAASLELKNGVVKVVTAEKNMGKGHAIRLAVGHSTGDVVLYTDCDLAYGVDVITEAYLTMTAPDFDGDVLIGSRNLRADGYEGYTFLRKVASKCYIKVLCTIAGFKLSDSQCGFKAFRGDAARKVFSYGTVNGWAFDLEILMTAQKLGYKIKEFPVKIINHRESKIHLAGDSIRMLRDVARIKKQVSQRFK
ncbi:MAG: glycosyltransferase [Ruminococcaceae bacterium]|nr:glycosyltransferase [Oscillospiraceae bacterium]